MSKQYETVIGLEVHVELATKTKIFCGCSTAFGGAPNTHTCPVCTGMPGSLPVLNKQVVEYAMAVGLAANCQINQYCKFDRKNYFYPDNPQNYQISQLYLPICHDGWVEIETESGVKKKIGIHEIHMEEDAGKLYLGHVDNEDFISDLQLSKSCCILSAYFLCGRSAAVSFLHRQSAAYGAVPFHEGHLKHWMARPSGRYPGYGAIFLQFRSSGVHRRKALRSSAPYRYHIHLARYG